MNHKASLNIINPMLSCPQDESESRKIRDFAQTKLFAKAFTRHALLFRSEGHQANRTVHLRQIALLQKNLEKDCSVDQRISVLLKQEPEGCLPIRQLLAFNSESKSC